MLLTDVQPYDSDVLHLSISTETYCPGANWPSAHDWANLVKVGPNKKIAY